MAFGMDASVLKTTHEQQISDPPGSDGALVKRATRLFEMTRLRDEHFRRAVMADSVLAIMLSLFLAELRGVSLTSATLALVNMLDGGECDAVVDSLVHAGLAELTGINPERRSVGLSALGSARMRSYIGAFPDI